ncbi:MAG TPA: hypothetical protein VMF89_20175, partial [Polyangiales bacterium]|nr:hypothetical protein [Polyangiales bacterium]
MACSSSLAPAAQRNTVPASEHSKPESTARFERDTAQSTAHGTATFVVPAGWSLVKERDLTRVRAPEGDEVFAIVDLAEPNGAAAIAAAWHAIGRTPQWSVEHTAELPARDGWLGGLALDYEVPPNLKRTLRAFALHGTARTIVVLLETDSASFEKRMSALALLADSLRPSGYQRESFSRRSAHALDAPRLAKLDALIELAQKELAIPGVAVALVQGDQV